jgi:hypothetical protein
MYYTQIMGWVGLALGWITLKILWVGLTNFGLVLEQTTHVQLWSCVIFMALCTV